MCPMDQIEGTIVDKLDNPDKGLPPFKAREKEFLALFRYVFGISFVR